jgi:hypothetical protein
VLAIAGVPLAGLFVAVPENPFPADSAWPYAITVSLAWGAVVPAAWLGSRALGLRGVARGAAFLLGLVAGGVVLSAALYLAGVAPQGGPMTGAMAG